MVSIRVKAIGEVNPKPIIEGTTIYQCFQKERLVLCANTESYALQWLSDNGGGIYKNTLHGYQFEVKPDEYKNLLP